MPPTRKYADIKVGYGCNNDCFHCVIADKRRTLKTESKPINRSTEDVFHQIDQAKLNGSDRVVLTGGEITIRDDVFRIVKYVKDKDMSINMQTNGRMFFYNDFCQKMVDIANISYVIALHAPIAEIHDEITAVKGSFKQTVQGIKNLISHGQEVGGKIVLSKKNFGHLPEIVKLFSDLGVSNMNVAFPHGMGNAMLNFDSCVPTYTEIKPFVDRAINLAEKNDVQVTFEAIPFCFMVGNESLVSELRIPKSELRDLDHMDPDYEYTRKNVAKKKGPLCPECRYYPICEGPWIEYPRKRGFDEFKPVPGEKITDPNIFVLPVRKPTKRG